MTIRSFSEADARAVCAWRYPPPEDVYDLPDWAAACRAGMGLTDGETRAREFRAVEEQGALAGYFRLRRLEGCVVAGLGLRPDLCGGGRGQGLMALIVSEATARYPGVPLRLEVRPGNRRAVRCYERAGFVPLETVTRVTPTGETPLLLMEYRPGGKT